MTRPIKELKGFKRIHLKAKESITVTFGLAINQLGFYNGDMKYIVEPGNMALMVGSSSVDIRAQGNFTVSGEITDVSEQKVFFSKVNLAKK